MVPAGGYGGYWGLFHIPFPLFTFSAKGWEITLITLITPKCSRKRERLSAKRTPATSSLFSGAFTPPAASVTPQGRGAIPMGEKPADYEDKGTK
jgi:hypothetical protein